MNLTSMRVGIVAESIYGFVSGAAIFTKRLIGQLSPHVEKVVVITAGEKKAVKTRGNRKIYFFPELKLSRLKKFPIALFKFKAVREILEKEKLDILHIQLPSPLCVAALFFARKMKMPVMITSHTQPENVLGNLNIKSHRAKKTFYRYVTAIYNLTDCVVCPSKYAKKELLLHKLKKSKDIEIISNGIDIDYFVPGKPKKIILFVGRIMKEKDIPTLIRASAIVSKTHPDYRFIIAGAGYLEDELKKLASEINPSVIFTGKVSDKELLRLYQSASIFVLPSESELQGLVLLEAMSCGVPTIASDSKTSAARELANFLFRHGSEKDLARKINFLIENPKIADRLRKENRKYILKEHSIKKLIFSYINAYKRVIKNG
jgi:glycosyltransferase involved in cell wall biosynthesis